MAELIAGLTADPHGAIDAAVGFMVESCNGGPSVCSSGFPDILPCEDSATYIFEGLSIFNCETTATTGLCAAPAIMSDPDSPTVDMLSPVRS